MISVGAIKCVLIGAVICVTLGSCVGLYEMLVFANSVEEQEDRYEGMFPGPHRIMFFIDNQTDETLVLFVNGYFKGAELVRVPAGSMREIYISKGRTIYVSGGTTQREYGQWKCNDESEVFPIY